MPERFLDTHALHNVTHGFVERKHGIAPGLVILVLAIIFSTMMAFFLIRVPAHSLELTVVTALVLAGLGTWLVKILRELQRTITLTEYQNALFAGAARQGSDFSIIVNREGAVVYVDPEFLQRFMPGTKHVLHIGAVWNALGMEESDRLLLNESITEGRSEARSLALSVGKSAPHPFSLSLVPIEIWNDHANQRRWTLSVDPITRPSGYLLIRARDEKIIEQQDNFFDLFHMGWCSFSTTGECLDLNETATSVLGFKDNKQALKQAPSLSHLLPDTLLYSKVLSTQTPWHGEITWSHVDHHPIQTHAHVALRRNYQNHITEIHIIFVPRNFAGPMEIEGKSVLERLPGFLENSPIPSALIDKNGAVISTNKAFRVITEKSDNIRQGWNMLESVKAEDQKHVSEYLHSVATRSSEPAAIKPLDVKLIGEKGVSASLFVSRLPRRNSAPIRMIAHFIDMTEQKNLEMRFVHSQKMQAVGQLAGGVAHDFNNLLTAMMGFCDLLLMRHPAGDQSFADLMQIKQNANRAANLVRQLLAFSRKQTLQPVVLNITDILADVSNLVRRLIGENIEFKMVHGRDLGQVKVDQGQLEQVIINLAVNARDAMPKGGTLTVNTSNQIVDTMHPLEAELIPPAEDEIITPGAYVRIDVIDTGTGIPRNIINKIFEPFFSTKEVGSGTGLGLSTVYGIIKQTDGYVYVASKEGKGTTFSIFLKRHDRESGAAAAKSDALAQTDNSDLTGTGTVLLVEDETAVRMFSVSALRNKGYSVLEADCGEAGLKVMQEEGKTVDLIITDVIMPGMNGPAMIEEVMKLYPNLKVIFISGYAEDAFKETYGTDRHFHFLPKPYTLKQLAGKVKEVLTGVVVE